MHPPSLQLEIFPIKKERGAPCFCVFKSAFLSKNPVKSMLSAHFLCAPQVSSSARLYPIDRSFIFIFPMKNCNYTSHFLPNLSQISIF